jgi:hypothetical protein
MPGGLNAELRLGVVVEVADREGGHRCRPLALKALMSSLGLLVVARFSGGSEAPCCGANLADPAPRVAAFQQVEPNGSTRAFALAPR